ncbi:LADA_0H03862g1_1 [Lachancea dasiensis]|uniref:LADA_0H03862g1_1 n=1 Tax=Lachancea dasiensis TaxID=1072105 RepID=A0A1G4K0G6_9SACH|nr:LADA_0H03862g1_1 [Lachancea dasiensis]
MSFNSYHRRGSRSAAQATLAKRHYSDFEDPFAPTFNTGDVQILSIPLVNGIEDISEDSKLFTNEVRSEEYAILSTSSERDEDRSLHAGNVRSVPQEPPFTTTVAPSLYVARSALECSNEHNLVSNAQRIDDWCVQSDHRSPLLKIPANSRVQEVVEAWGVENESLTVQKHNNFAESRPAVMYPDNYTSHLLELMNPVQKLRLLSFAESMLPFLKRRQAPELRPTKFRDVPSVFVNRDFQLQCALNLEMRTSNSTLAKRERGEETFSSSSQSESYNSISRSSGGMQSWYSWNLVARLSTDQISNF